MLTEKLRYVTPYDLDTTIGYLRTNIKFNQDLPTPILQCMVDIVDDVHEHACGVNNLQGINQKLCMLAELCAEYLG